MAGFGLRLSRSQGMGGFSGNLQQFDINPSNTGQIYTGDPVILTSGWLVEATGAADNGNLDVAGVFAGCEYVNAAGELKFSPYWTGEAGATNIRGMVAMANPDSLYIIKGKTGVTYTRAAFGGRFGFTYLAGSSKFGDSRVVLGAAAVSTGPLKVHRLLPIPNNAFTVDQAIFEVSICRPQLAAGLAA